MLPASTLPTSSPNFLPAPNVNGSVIPPIAELISPILSLYLPSIKY